MDIINLTKTSLVSYTDLRLKKKKKLFQLKTILFSKKVFLREIFLCFNINFIEHLYFIF